MTTLKQCRQAAINRLAKTLSTTLPGYDLTAASLDTDVLLESILNITRSHILAHGDTLLTQEQLTAFEAAISKRLTGYPIAYITHTKEFFALNFFVDETVLIPKSDTEPLIETALKTILSFNHAIPISILDVCSGSGCIGISLVKNLILPLKNRWSKEGRQMPSFQQKTKAVTQKPISPLVALTFQDISEPALEVAKKNAFSLLANEIASGLVEVDFFCKDLKLMFPPGKKFQAIVSNPPYVPSRVVAELLQDGRSEPSLALDGGADGLELYPFLAKRCFESLLPGGLVFVEAGEYNIESATEVFKKVGFTNLKIYQDLSSLPRFFSAKV